MNKRVKIGVVALSFALVASLIGALYVTFRLPVAEAVGDCTSIQSMLTETKNRMTLYATDTSEYYALETQAKDIGNALAACLGTPDDTATINPPPSEGTGKYACRPTFYNERSGTVSNYAFGKPVTQKTPTGVLKELKHRTWCDPSLLVAKSFEYNVSSVSSLNALERDKLANKLTTQARKGEQAAWDKLYNAFIAKLDGAKNSLATIDPGTYQSRQMINMGDGKAPRVTNVMVTRTKDDHREVLRSVLPDGTVIDSRLYCGFQLQAKTPGDVPTLTPNIPRDHEGKPKPKIPVCRIPGPGQDPKVIWIRPKDRRPTDDTPKKQDGNWTCEKHGAPQPSGVASPTGNPVGSPSASPTPKKTPLLPTATATPTDKGDGHKADGGQADQSDGKNDGTVSGG